MQVSSSGITAVGTLEMHRRSLIFESTGIPRLSRSFALHGTGRCPTWRVRLLPHPLFLDGAVWSDDFCEVEIPARVGLIVKSRPHAREMPRLGVSLALQSKENGHPLVDGRFKEN
jgi:hypothetical protein